MLNRLLEYFNLLNYTYTSETTFGLEDVKQIRKSALLFKVRPIPFKYFLCIYIFGVIFVNVCAKNYVSLLVFKKLLARAKLNLVEKNKIFVVTRLSTVFPLFKFWIKTKNPYLFSLVNFITFIFNMLSPINLQLKNKDLLDLERLVISHLPKTRSASKPDINTFRPNTGIIPLNKGTQKLTKVLPIPNLDRFLTPRVQPSPVQGSLELTTAQNLTDRVKQAPPIQNLQTLAFSSSHFEHAKLEPKTCVTHSPQTTKVVKTIERIDKRGNIPSPRFEQIKLRKFESSSKSNIYSLKIGSYIDTDQHIAPASAKGNGMTGFFKENRKKYPPKAQFFSLAQKAKECHYEDNIGLIKSQAKQSVFKRAKISLPSRIDMKQKTREMTAWPSNKLEMTKEDETKLNILRKKMETFTKFNAMSNMDDRKKLYRELTLEYHPDKSKHEKALCEEIFAFLRNNKKTFLVC